MRGPAMYPVVGVHILKVVARGSRTQLLKLSTPVVALRLNAMTCPVLWKDASYAIEPPCENVTASPSSSGGTTVQSLNPLHVELPESHAAFPVSCVSAPLA